MQKSIKSPSLLSNPAVLSQIPTVLNQPEESMRMDQTIQTEKNESKEMKYIHITVLNRLSRDRAAARLRRMRKKSNIEISELKINYIKERLNVLRVGNEYEN